MTLMRRTGHSKLVVRDGKIVKQVDRLTFARTKVVLAACAYIPPKPDGVPCSFAVLEDAVEEYRSAVAEDEKGRHVT
jgi:hypothetical protein